MIRKNHSPVKTQDSDCKGAVVVGFFGFYFLCQDHYLLFYP